MQHDIIKFDRYKENLMVIDDSIYSYNTKVADINHENRTITKLGYYSQTTSKHINYVAKEYGYTIIN